MNTARPIAAAACLAAALSAMMPAWAEDGSSAKAAREMLKRAAAAVTADEPRALAAFRSGAAGFRNGDLYVFCAGRDGRLDAHVDPALIGKNLKDLYDVDGVAFGQEMLAVATAGSITAVSYMFPKPASRVPAQKVTFVTRAADQICGVGYYK